MWQRLSNHFYNIVVVTLLGAVVLYYADVGMDQVWMFLTNHPSFLEDLQTKLLVLPWTISIGLLLYASSFLKGGRLKLAAERHWFLLPFCLMLFCSVVGLLFQTQTRKPDLVLIGSGTVHGYLQEVLPSLLDKTATPKVLVLEGVPMPVTVFLRMPIKTRTAFLRCRF